MNWRRPQSIEGLCIERAQKEDERRGHTGGAGFRQRTLRRIFNLPRLLWTSSRPICFWLELRGIRIEPW